MPAPKPTMPILTVVIPTLNEMTNIEEGIDALRTSIRLAGVEVEIILSDGGSEDGSREWILSQPDLMMVSSPRGRAIQMNAAAAVARAPWLMFLHADSRVSPDLIQGLLPHLVISPDIVYSFALRFRSAEPVFRRFERGVAWRCDKLGLPYGDQGLCISRRLFERMGGFRPDAPAEDLDFVLRLRSHGRIVMLPRVIETSTRQWDHQGLVIGTAYNVGRLAAYTALHFLRGDHLAPR